MDLEVLRTKFETLGPHQVLGHYLYQGLNRLFPLEAVRAFCLSPSDVPPPPVLRGDMQCERLDEASLRREAAVPGSGLRTPDVESCLAGGEECFGVFVDDVLASHAWYTSKTARLRPGVSVRFDSRYVYSRWAFTRPEYRGRGLHAHGKRYALGHYVAAGRSGLLSTVSIANFESLNSAARVGGRPVGLMVAASLRDRWLLWASAGCRGYGMGLERD